jgi:hypothetical protein
MLKEMMNAMGERMSKAMFRLKSSSHARLEKEKRNEQHQASTDGACLAPDGNETIKNVKEL